MTHEEFARRVSAVKAEARQRVPEWEPWMTAKVGYAGVSEAAQRRARKAQRDRERYLRRVRQT